MATAAQVIKAALQKILVQASESAIDADQYSDAMNTLNDLMNAYAAEGINLGYTEVTSIGDAVTVPAGALRGIIYNLAIDLAPEYGGEVTPAVVKIASDGYDAMMMIGVDTPVSSLPCTLPVGIANEGNDGWANPFYAEDEDAILTETTGAVGLESGTTEAS